MFDAARAPLPGHAPDRGLSAGDPASGNGAGAGPASRSNEHSRELFWHTLGRLVFLYFVPLLLLAVFFGFQYRQLLGSSVRAHLETTAEHHARLFDLFLRERLANLSNIADDPAFSSAAVDGKVLEAFLAELRHVSEAFLDLGVVDERGYLTAYAGPVSYPAGFNYQHEDWLRQLVSEHRASVITDIYLGFRGRPHFTIALLRAEGSHIRILRAALSPERLSEYLSGLEGASEVRAAVVNTGGILQVTTPRVGKPLALSPFAPPREPRRGWVRGEPRSGRPDYAYDWMSEAPWALVVTPASGTGGGIPAAGRGLLPAVGLFLLMGVVILIRTRQVVGRQLATEQHEAELSGQLVHAAKLASVGELAAGIAHEINNPLAIIAEEVGELKDSMDPSLPKTDEEPLDLGEHLDAIIDAVFRCRDITRKLLSFVRQTDVKAEHHCVNEVLDDVLGTMLANELMLSNVNVVRSYDDSPTTVFVDRNQLVQVFVNLVKNAIDAMPRGGVLTVSTMIREHKVVVSVRDTGCGMTPDQLARVFTPFFTTKEPGMGTGLGLSVSYMIIQNFGGAFYVDSVRGKGSVFSVELPMAEEPSAAVP